MPDEYESLTGTIKKAGDWWQAVAIALSTLEVPVTLAIRRLKESDDQADIALALELETCLKNVREARTGETQQ